MNTKIAIIVVGYNRPDSLTRILISLNNAQYDYDNIPLVISIDHSGNQEVVQVANEFQWDYGTKEVIYHPQRLGLRKHIITCGDLSEKYGAVMLLEDDLFVSPDFYNYAMQALEKYGDHPSIAGIGLNTLRHLLESSYPFFPLRTGYDVYFQQFATSWGQVWNHRMWIEFKTWYNINQPLPYSVNVPLTVLNYPETSWAKFFQTYIVENNKFFVYSYDSLTTNFGDAGEHFDHLASSVQSVLFYGKKNYHMPDFETGIKYDIYGEPLGLGKYLNIAEEDLTCDFWQRKQPQSYKRFLLTSIPKPYHLLKSFGINLKPFELNIFNHISGEGIYLYDLTCPNPNIKSEKNSDIRLLEYSYGSLNGRDLLRWTLKRILQKILK